MMPMRPMTHQPGQCHRIVRFVHALFRLIYTEEAASHLARPAGSLKALAIVSRRGYVDRQHHAW